MPWSRQRLSLSHSISLELPRGRGDFLRTTAICCLVSSAHSHDGVTIFNRVRTILPRGELGRAVMTLVVGTGTAQGLVILTSPILTRLYSPSDYGTYAVATSMLAVLLTVTCLRYETAILLPESEVAGANTLAVSLLGALGTSMITGLVLWFTGGALLGLFGAGSLSPYMLLLAVGQFAGGVMSAFTSWAVRTRAFSEVARTRVTQSLALVVVQIGSGLIGLGAPGLLVGDVVGRSAGSSRLVRAAWRVHAPSFRSVTRKGMAAAATRYKRFPIFSSGSALLATLGLQAPLLLLVAFYGTEVGGQFAIASRICAIPLTLVAAAVGQVFMSEAARLARTEPIAVRALFVRTTRSLATVAIGPAILLAVAAPFVFGPIFGAAWRQAGLFVAILAASYFVEFVIAATGDVLYVLERQGLQLAREIARFVFLVGAVPIAAALHLSPVGAVVLVSLSGCATYALYGLISWRSVVGYSERGSPDAVTE